MESVSSARDLQKESWEDRRCRDGVCEGMTGRDERDGPRAEVGGEREA